MDALKEWGFNKIYFAIKGEALYSLIAFIRRELSLNYPKYQIDVKWSEYSNTRLAFITVNVVIPRRKVPKTISINFVREMGQTHKDSNNEDFTMVNHVFKDISGDLLWFKENCNMENILQAVEKNPLIYPYSSSLSSGIF